MAQWNGITAALDLACANNAEIYAELRDMCGECERVSEYGDALRYEIENRLPIYAGADDLTNALLGAALNAVDWYASALRWRERYEENGGDNA